MLPQGCEVSAAGSCQREQRPFQALQEQVTCFSWIEQEAQAQDGWVAVLPGSQEHSTQLHFRNSCPQPSPSLLVGPLAHREVPCAQGAGWVGCSRDSGGSCRLGSGVFPVHVQNNQHGPASLRPCTTGRN